MQKMDQLLGRTHSSSGMIPHLLLPHLLRSADSRSDPAVSRLDVTSSVPDVTAHLIVGEVRLLNQLRRVHRHLGKHQKRSR